MQLRSQVSSVCWWTWLCTKSVQRSGSSPAASSSIAVRRVALGVGGGVPRQGEAVEVDDAVQRLVGGGRVLLRRHPVLHRAQVVAQMDLAGGLDAREHARHGA